MFFIVVIGGVDILIVVIINGLVSLLYYCD